MKQFIVAIATATAACGSSPVAPAPVQPRQLLAVSYDINIPVVAVADQLNGAFPQGISVTPVQAQHDYDYTAVYGGTPNVYAGPSVDASRYLSAGILVAPLAAASKMRFTSADWPDAGLRDDADYTWVGHFTSTMTVGGFK